MNFYLLEKSNVWTKKSIRNIIFILAILIPCLIAGFRANQVGVDVEVYIVPSVEKAFYCNSFFDVCSVLNMGNEYFYMFLVYICTRFSSDCGLLLFMIQFFTIVPIALAVMELRKEISISIAMCVYFFYFYNNSLNMMRQSVCAAFILLGSVYLIKKEAKINLKTLICFLLAFLFHNSAIIGIICVWILIKITYSNKSVYYKYVIFTMIVAIPTILPILVEKLNSWGFLSEKYLIYANIFLYHTVDKNYFVNPFSLRILVDVFARIIIVFFSLYFYNEKNAKKLDLKYTSLKTLTINGLLIYLVILFTMKTVYGMRISFFMDLFSILLLAYSVNGKNNVLKKIVIILFMFIYWYLWVMIGGWSGSNMYEFRI
jgi:hypothetical protein